MKREVVITADGSSTIHLPDWNEQYHSKHGAIQEAYHVFIKHGLQYFYTENIKDELESISILEIGFGTGLNAFITFLEAEKLNIKTNYVGVEAYPVSSEEITLLNYAKELKAEENETVFKALHDVTWNEKHDITPLFSIEKQKKFFAEIKDEDVFNIIYFDAFGARVQPELWTEPIFESMYKALKKNGVLVTYAAKGSVRRAMQAVGFTVQRLEGPPGKREMLRGIK
ncbi:tRNA (5-methylaminomethyl-2-thiouridine)(34)-methyltransferase MnmD [Algibacter sp. L4_22]|uniref:tRNA (5-methylaminomethyl-2-thiouridine)(34)-methyltransferase MnmD n=1 Tax=Algibacter sp. L4_22 TaxID=2942477 RepID=UPI00201B9059|nr:tRNA (5-methylaminomethyl-2-thiouridine)(34)-methyltransferase MnmD [Algibacter sp. L4_22]MCL5128825.1 tRNA (5-methylaminomethyl-2-thiouridine)(34)-methyltransferase MnmD [Algibacter sp. L4_22]